MPLMNRLKRRVMLLCIALVTLPAILAAQPLERPRRVLLLHSYHQGFAFTDSVTRGIFEVFRSSGMTVDVHIEYLDTKRLLDQQYLDELLKLYQYKYRTMTFDAVMVSDNDALAFIRKHRHELAGHAPVVFDGINDFSPAMIEGMTPVTGVIEAADYHATIELMPRLLPQVRRVLVITDTTTTGQAHAAAVRKIEPLITPGLTLEYVSFADAPGAELEARLRSLTDDTAVLLLQHVVDGAGVRYEMSESTRTLSTVSAVPVFTVTDYRVEHGALGGKVVDGALQGRSAAALALRLLKGESAASIPIITDSPNVYLFNYQQLRRFHVPLSRLPAGSRVLNEPVSLYRKHRVLIWSVVVVLAGLLGGIVVLSINIGRRKRAEASLRSSESRNRAMLSAIPDMIFLTTPEGLFLDVHASNPQALVRSPAELKGRRYQDVLPAEAVGLIAPAFDRAVATGNLEVVKYELTVENSVRSMEARIVPCGDAVLSIVRDITIESQLQAAQERSGRLEAVGILAGGIAHDFNNLLMTIAGNATLAGIILRERPGEAATALSSLRNLEDAAMRARDLTQQLLTFSKGGAPQMRDVDIETLVAESVRFALTDSKSSCSIEQPRDRLWCCRADPGQISQVLNNLLRNADQAMPQGGRITVRLENMSAGEDPALPLTRGPYVKISVTDTGTGISAAILPQIFNPFFTTRSRGSGLGLASAHSIVRAHGGHIGVESVVGKGAVFTVYIPAHPDARPEAETAAVAGHAEGGGRILVMDDEPLIQELLHTALSRQGYTVLTASDGRAAVLVAEAELRAGRKIDLVVLDLTVPHGLGGVETAPLLRALDASTKLICSSGYANDPALAEPGRFGFDGRIAKPYHLADLYALIASLMEKQDASMERGQHALSLSKGPV